MTRHIAHLDIPDFYAALEGLRRPELAKRPLALAEQGTRSVIQGVSSVARSEGICEGMSLSHARRLCRRLLAVPPDYSFYKERHKYILREFDRFSPLVEGARQGRYFVDLTGTKRLWGPCPDAACRMERLLSDKWRLHARVGLASNKLVSQMAAACITPGDLSCIFIGGERSFLTPLPVTSLLGVGPKTAARLADFNIQRVGELASIPAGSLCDVFGNMGHRLLRMAVGDDATPVVSFQRAPTFNIVNNLDRDEIDLRSLEAIVLQQVEEAGWMLRSHNRHPGRFVLELRYADGFTARSRHPLPQMTAHIDRSLFRVVFSSFKRLFQRRVAVRRIALELSDFSTPYKQMALFPWEEGAPAGEQRLQQALDGIRSRYGRASITWGLALAAGSPGKITVASS
jgi:DNA polymerase-4